MENINIRKANLSDIPAIHNLVRQLAVYEHAEHEFIATIQEYQEDFANKVFDVIVAEDENKVIGMVLYYLTYSTWKGKMLYLEDFVVDEAYRRMGIGQVLFDAFMEEANELNCKLIKLQVLDWNDPAIQFYQKNKCVIEKEWWNCKRFL